MAILQSPKGTRDFYPAEQAFRRYIHNAWERVSIRHGFEEVDGPVFETLDLYKVKSGDGIVSELFHFEDRGERELALRPEFTPTLARMVAAKANALPRPVKWFTIPTLCRAEKPQRGRLREFDQWNVDFLGSDSPMADAEVIFCAVDLLKELGLTSDEVKVRLSHREAVRTILSHLGVHAESMDGAFNLLDAKSKMRDEDFKLKAAALGLSPEASERFAALCAQPFAIGEEDALRTAAGIETELPELKGLGAALKDFGLAGWCVYDLSIVRGLAYYTGTVFELHVASGKERALGGGGRYDKLVEMFGGPSVPAVGFGMGDVVLGNLLTDLKKLPERLAPAADVFVLASSDLGATQLAPVVAQLRSAGLHARMSYKTTRNVGKVLPDAQKCGAKFAVILGDEAGVAQVKTLVTGEQKSVDILDLVRTIKGA